MNSQKSHELRSMCLTSKTLSPNFLFNPFKVLHDIDMYDIIRFLNEVYGEGTFETPNVRRLL